MDDFFAAVHLPAWVLAILVAEAVLLLALWRWRGVGIAPAPLLSFLTAGACMTLAVDAGLAGAPGRAAAWLGAALPPHLLWLFMAWRRRG